MKKSLRVFSVVGSPSVHVLGYSMSCPCGFVAKAPSYKTAKSSILYDIEEQMIGHIKDCKIYAFLSNPILGAMTVDEIMDSLIVNEEPTND